MATHSKMRQTKSSKNKSKKVTPLVRILPQDKAFLEKIALRNSKTMPEILHNIIEKFKRQEFFDELVDAYADLKSNHKAWAEEIEERRLYNNTLADGFIVGENDD